MHIPDGILNSNVCSGLGMAAAGLVAYSLKKIKSLILQPSAQPALAAAARAGQVLFKGKFPAALSPSYLKKMGMITSLVFALQMFNFPVTSGTSGHLLGGMLAALFLGPWGGAISLSAVLFIQSVFYSDGGIIALGANIINMSFFGCVFPYYLYLALKGRSRNALAIALSCWFSVFAAAFAVSLEIAFSGTYDLVPTVTSMLGIHSLIGIGEAGITLLCYSAVKRLIGPHQEE